MNDGPCSVKGCSKPAKAREWCSAHYELWRKNGDPLIKWNHFRVSAEQRFAELWTLGSYLNVPGLKDCHLWLGHLQRGYGAFSDEENRSVGAHVWAYTHFVGAIPEGYQLDHTCHNIDLECVGGFSCLHRGCVNTDHLEPVTPREHAQRSPHAWANRTHCPRGHPYSPENTRISNGSRFCKECNRMFTRRLREKRKTA